MFDTPFSGDADMAFSFSPMLFTSPRPMANQGYGYSTNSPQNEDGLSVLADSCLASAEKPAQSSSGAQANAVSSSSSKLSIMGDSSGDQSFDETQQEFMNSSFLSLGEASMNTSMEMSPSGIMNTSPTLRDMANGTTISPIQGSEHMSPIYMADISMLSQGTSTKRKHQENDGDYSASPPEPTSLLGMDTPSARKLQLSMANIR
jgi:hypothetical protein